MANDYVWDPDIQDWVPSSDTTVAEQDISGTYDPGPRATSSPLIEQMKQEEASLTLPISKGRMYMGPMLSPEAEKAFLQKPSGTSINLMPPPSGPPPTQLENIQAASPSWATPISIRRDVPMPIPEDPGAARFALLSEYQRMRAAGVPESEAASRVGLNLMGASGYGMGRRYNVAGVGLVDQYGNVVAPAPKKEQRGVSVAGVGLVNPVTGEVMVPTPEKITETETIPATFGTPAIPAQSARKGFLGIGAREAAPAVPATPAKGEKRITTTVRGEPTSPEKITSKAEYDALPKGAIYIGKDGKRYRKP